MNNTTSVVIMIMMVTLFMIIFGTILEEMKTAYPEENLETSFGNGSYDYISNIQNASESIKDDLDKVQDEKFGWKTFAVGLTAIPNFLLSFLSIMLGAILYPVSIISGFANTLGIPKQITGIVTAMVGVFLIFLLVQWWQGGKK